MKGQKKVPNSAWNEKELWSCQGRETSVPLVFHREEEDDYQVGGYKPISGGNLSGNFQLISLLKTPKEESKEEKRGEGVIIKFLSGLPRSKTRSFANCRTLRNEDLLLDPT